MSLCWTTPLIVLCSYCVAVCFDYLAAQRRPPRSTRSKRLLVSAALLLVAITPIFQGAVLCYRAALESAFVPSVSINSYLTFTFIVYSWLGLRVLEVRRTRWLPYAGASAIGMTFETLQITRMAQVSKVYFGLACARIMLLSILSGYIISIILAHRIGKPLGITTGDTTPLLARDDGDASHANQYGIATDDLDPDRDLEHAANGCDSRSPTTRSRQQSKTPADDSDADTETDSDSDDSEDESDKKHADDSNGHGSADDHDDHDKIARLERQQRVRELGYVKVFLQDAGLLLSIVLPQRPHYVHLCLSAAFFSIMGQRLLNVLVPLQYGKLIDALTASARCGHLPIQPLVTWGILNYISSSAGIHLLSRILEIPTDQFAYKSIGMTSFGHIVGLSADYHNNKSSPEIIAGIQQSQNVYYLLNQFFTWILPGFVDLFIGLLYLTWLFDFNITLILIVNVHLFGEVGFKSVTTARRYRRRVARMERKEKRVITESLLNWSTVASLARGAHQANEYSLAIDRMQSSQWNWYLMLYSFDLLENIISKGAYYLLMVAAAWKVSSGDAPIGHFIALASFYSTMQTPLNMLSYTSRQISKAMTDTEMMLRTIRLKPTVQDRPGAASLHITEGTVEVKNVSFGYNRRKAIVKNISFQATAGQTIAFVGKTGGGKSTIFNLLYRLYDVSSGKILIDGQDIRNVTQDSLREAFGIVPQSPALFNISIMENLRYANLDATNEEVYDACRSACIHDNILAFPKGYASRCGERGVKLSGGELQRIAIARAILRKPRIVLLDEATAAVDAITEDAIQTAINRLRHNRTVFVIAHRLTTIQDADQIIVIDEGEAIERGTHKELCAQQGRYYALWAAQMKDGAKNNGEVQLDVSDQTNSR